MASCRRKGGGSKYPLPFVMPNEEFSEEDDRKLQPRSVDYKTVFPPKSQYVFTNVDPKIIKFPWELLRHLEAERQAKAQAEAAAARLKNLEILDALEF